MYFVINFREKAHIYSKTQGGKNWNLATNPDLETPVQHTLRNKSKFLFVNKSTKALKNCEEREWQIQNLYP